MKISSKAFNGIDESQPLQSVPESASNMMNFVIGRDGSLIKRGGTVKACESYGNIDAIWSGNINGEETLVARYKLKAFSVELQFVEVNSDGHKMLDSETVDIVYGTNFIYEIPAINGYVASQTKVDLGIVTTQPEGPIIIEYTPALYNLTIQLFDKDGKSLGSQIVKDIQVGSTYKIALDPVEGYLTDGIVIEDTMGPNDTNKIVSIVLEKKPEETQDDPGETDPTPGNPEPDPADNTFETVIVIVLVVMVLALGAMIFYVSYLKKNNG
jgi:hypothetical protein